MITDIKKLDEDLRKILSEKRYLHSVGVMKMCEKLANIYNADIEKAKLIGLMHDMAKELSKKEKLDYVKKNNIACNEIERIELIPETAIILLNGKTYIVKNSAEEVIEKIVQFNRKIHVINKSV